MKDVDTFQNEASLPYLHEEILESEVITQATSRMKKILEAHYEKADLMKVVNNCTHLSQEERVKLYQLLKRYEHLFDATLGQWT